MFPKHTNNSISTIRKQFLCGVPIKNINLENSIQELTEWDNQNCFIEQTVNSKQVLKFPLKISYQKAFIKLLIDLLIKQNAEVHDVVYDALGRLMALNEPEKVYKHYYFFEENSIILEESSGIISEGTTGLCTWQASLAFSEWSLINPQIFKHKRVLELGSGVGLTGLVISKFCQPKRFTFSDCHDSVLKSLNSNISLNLNVDLKSESFYNNTEIKLTNLSWELVNLTTQEIYETDVAVAADVVYDNELFLPLQNLFKLLLKHGNCSAILLACSERNPETLTAFMNLLSN